MNGTGQDAPDSSPTGANHMPTGTGSPRGARAQGATMRRARGHRPALALAAAAVVALAAAATLLAACASSAPSPLAAVMGALAKTSAESYSFTLASRVQAEGSERNWSVVSGAFDPRHELGAESVTTFFAQRTVRAQIRFIGKYVYTWISHGSRFPTIGKPWDKASAAATRPPYDPYGFVSDQPVSPAELSRVLRSAGTARDEGSASGSGWTGTKYAFAAHLSERDSVSGTMYVDQQGRVLRLVTIATEGGVTTDRNLAFGDFGALVSVTAPSISQVKYTHTPYWGFFF
jgi:hypothetical protein